MFNSCLGEGFVGGGEGCINSFEMIIIKLENIMVKIEWNVFLMLGGFN